MLIYNFQKEFVGIDEKDLKTLGFTNLQGLRAEVHDFADLFVKTPGYVHNFKHVHWIDFISCAESNEESKVIINVNNKNYTAVVQIATAFLVDSPASKGFLVTLHNLRELTVAESERISGDITQREAPLSPSEPQQIFANSPAHVEDAFDTPTQRATQVETVESAITTDPYEVPLDVMMDDEPTLPVSQEIPVVEKSIESLDIHFDDSQEENLDIPLEIDIDDDFEDVLTQDFVEKKSSSTHTEMIKESFENGYTYDPHVASDELGLPIDLIEEFIQDFIEQAKEFKEDLYRYLDESDLDNLKILSHKLKGVAANLRIEDALETITVVNTESNINLISENLDTFYKIIAKLSGEEVVTAKEVENISQEVDPVDAVVKIDMPDEEIDLYSDPETIDDVNIAEKIDIPEMSDDALLEEEPSLSDETEPLLSEAQEKLELEEETQESEIELADDFQVDNQDILETENEDIPLEINYSKEIAANEIGLDIESFNELFEDYIKEVKEISSSIKKALRDEDISSVNQESLKLKGMSENMRVTSFSKELDTLINSKDSQDISSALETIDKIIELLSSKEG